MTYIDGMVTPVTTDRETYRAFAERTAAIVREYGALRIAEGWGDDVPDGRTTDFRRAVGGQAGDQVAFSWIEWPDKATRDAAWPKLMADERMQQMGEMPFDGPRLIYGGFEVIVDV